MSIGHNKNVTTTENSALTGSGGGDKEIKLKRPTKGLWLVKQRPSGASLGEQDKNQRNQIGGKAEGRQWREKVADFFLKEENWK